jgi:hypothetical protein
MLIRNVQPLHESVEQLVCMRWSITGMTIPMCMDACKESGSSHVVGACDKSGAESSSGNATIAGWRCMYSKSVQQVSPAESAHQQQAFAIGIELLHPVG